MNDGQLMKLKNSLKAEISSMETELAQNKEKHKEMIGDLKTQMADMKKREDKAKEDHGKAGDEAEKGKKEFADKDAQAMGDLEDSVRQAKEARDEAATMRKAVAIRLSDMAVCGCEAGAALADVSEHKPYEQPSTKKIAEANEIVGLQTKRDNLDEEVSNEMRDFSNAQGASLDSKERLTVAQNLRSNRMTAEATAHEKEGPVVEKSSTALANYAAAHKAKLARAQADLEPLKAKIAELDGEMKKCGCGPGR